MNQIKIWKRIGIIFCLFIVTMVVLLISGRTASTITREKTFISSTTEMTDEMENEFDEIIVENDKVYTLSGIKENSEVVEEEPHQHVIEKMGMTKDEINPERVMQLNINGESVTVYLKDITFEESPVTGRTASITDVIEYKNVESKPEDVPLTKEVEYTDEYTGEKIKVALDFVDLQEVSSPEWKNDLSEELTVEEYGADYYDMSGELIPHTDEGPDFTGKEDLLYKRFGLDKEKNVIQNVEWKGDVYIKDGVKCRDVAITGKRLVGTWKANYINENVPLPDATGYKAYIQYESKTSFMDIQYEITAVANYRNDSNFHYYIFGVAAVYIATLLFFIYKYRKMLFGYEEA